MNQIHDSLVFYDNFNSMYSATTIRPVNITNQSLLTVSMNSFMIV